MEINVFFRSFSSNDILSRLKLKHFDICIMYIYICIEQFMLSINNLTQKIATKVLCRLRSAVVKVDQGGHVDVQSHFTKAGTKIKRVGMDSTE